MRHARAYGLIGLTALAVAAVAYAQSTVTPLEESAPVETQPLNAAAAAPSAPAHWGDAKAGQTKSSVCAACHGVDGMSVLPNYPHIAGQSERYIARQVMLIKSGERHSGLAPVMQPLVLDLSEQDARDIGAYYEGQKAGAGLADDTIIAEGPNKGMKFYQVGERLFRGGDKERNIPACMACHGPAGSGNPGPAYPHLAGQDSAYSVRRLQEYRTGVTSEKDKHLFNVMAAVAKHLTDEEINSLGSYLRGLHLRPDAKEALKIAEMAASNPAPAPEPAAPAVEAAPADAASAPEATPETEPQPSEQQ